MLRESGLLAVRLVVLGVMAGLLWAGESASAERATEMTKPHRSEPAKSGKVLNNFVTVLLDVSPCELGRSYRFDNPREGWVFVATTAQCAGNAKAWVTVDGSPKEQAVIVHQPDTSATLETMRYLSAGEHLVAISAEGNATIARLVVRAVPEIIYCRFPAQPHVREYGAYDWQFLSKHVLPHVNTIVGTGAEADRAYVEEWKKRGGKWIVECGLPGLSADSVTADEAYDYWASNPGLSDPLLDGIIVDEFLGANRPKEIAKYRAWTDAFERLRSEGKLRGKWFYPYCTELWRDEAPRRFAETVLAAGHRVALERYLREKPTEEEAEVQHADTLANQALLWNRVIPGSVERLIFTLGYMSAPPESLNADPRVDYKVFMDMQFNAIANRPECAGVYGIMEYLSAYADEEIVRWHGRLYRHYCIEGRTDRLSKDPYLLPHLENPDFDNGLEGWTVSPAEEGSIAVKNHERYGWLEGRYPRSRAGDNFLWAKRSATKPSTFSQTIKALEPGRLYSLKMYTGDYGELTAGKSTRQKHGVSTTIAGVELLPEKCFQHIFANCYSHHAGPFDNHNRLWMNYHQRVFRATEETAAVTISDWASDTNIGGPVGQELIFNFVEVQPYVPE